MSGLTFELVVRSAAGWIAHVQVNDANGRGPGMGEVKYEPILAALREVGYDGWLSVEAFDYAPGAEAIARESIEYLRSFPDPASGTARVAASPGGTPRG